MSLIDKLKFWKKDDSKIEEELFGNNFKDDFKTDSFKDKNNFNLDDDPLAGLPQAPPEPQSSFEQQRTFQQQRPQYQPNPNELILAKLDAIKATLDALNQRLSNLENNPNEKRRQW